MSGIIKAGSLSAQVPDPDGTAFQLVDLNERADHHLGQLRKEALRIVAEARAEAAKIRAQAEQEGRAAALAAAEKAATVRVDQHITTLLPALQQTIHEIQLSRDAWLRHWESSAVSLAAAIASRVIRGEVTRQPEIPLRLVREALELSAGKGQVVVHLHPRDIALLGDQLKRLTTELSRMAPAEVVPDDQITPGGCRVSTEFGEIDQRFESQIERITSELTS